MSEAAPRDWAAIFAEAKAGVLSKGEICRRFQVSREALDKKLAANGIVHGALLSRVEATVRASSAQVALLSDEEIVGAAAQRSSAVIKSHLTLTRSLQARLALLIEGYDEMVADAMAIDQEGSTTIDPKKWVQTATMLEMISRTAERLTKMEMMTFGISAAAGIKDTAATALLTGSTASFDKDDAMSASMAYQRVIQGLE